MIIVSIYAMWNMGSYSTEELAGIVLISILESIGWLLLFAGIKAITLMGT